MEGKKRVVPREVCTERSEKSNRYRKITLNIQKSAEANMCYIFFDSCFSCFVSLMIVRIDDFVINS